MNDRLGLRDTNAPQFAGMAAMSQQYSRSAAGSTIRCTSQFRQSGEVSDHGESMTIILIFSILTIPRPIPLPGAGSGGPFGSAGPWAFRGSFWGEQACYCADATRCSSAWF